MADKGTMKNAEGNVGKALNDEAEPVKSTSDTKPSVFPMDIIRLVFPDGTRQRIENEDATENSCSKVPSWPPDLFGICAYLLVRSGGYANVTPGGVSICDNQRDICFTTDEQDELYADGELWRENPLNIPEWAQAAWDDIIQANRALRARFATPYSHGESFMDREQPKWWRSALKLMSLADHVCQGIGAVDENDDPDHLKIMKGQIKAITEVAEDSASYVEDKSSLLEWVIPYKSVKSICSRASEDIFCVQPKSRTPSVGCTIRSLSQNLSLLPAAGEMESAWYKPPSNKVKQNDVPFNVLFIPYPYNIERGDFTIKGDAQYWRWFEVTQSWLPQNPPQLDSFIEFIDRLIKKASNDGTKIDAIIFPEYALKWPIYKKLIEHISSKIQEEWRGEDKTGKGTIYESIEYVISGSSSNCLKQHGNFVLTTQFIKAENEKGQNKLLLRSHSRCKHHRWQINDHQIYAYDLHHDYSVESKNEPYPLQDEPTNEDKPERAGRKIYRQAYWEKCTIPNRKIQTYLFRDKSVLTTLICEDLARAEPVHKYVRALGPNIVFVLLMDGCQLPFR